jgi:hypothetical protein
MLGEHYEFLLGLSAVSFSLYGFGRLRSGIY